MRNTEKLYLCERCRRKAEKSNLIVLRSGTIDNHDRDYECDICGAITLVLDLCEVSNF